ncbi:MAG TPA: hypothetical protein VEG64_14875 [Candidatus Sulfotelmatobacter sp.]|nr:hypothetical protein [Candidatus Sulfotelmatobacter sp.]
MRSRTALLIRCAEKEAATIREQARNERRTVSNYVLNIVVRAVQFEASLFANSRFRELRRRAYLHVLRAPGPRTAILVRCSTEEAEWIRASAEQRGATISGYVLRALTRSWKIKKGVAALASRERMKPYREFYTV